MDDDIPYLLLTPGPLTTSRTVRAAMTQDFCTWDSDYNSIVQEIRARLVRLTGTPERHTAVLMQGSGTFGVEATLGSVIPATGKLLIAANGAYGERMTKIASRLQIPHQVLRSPERTPTPAAEVDRALEENPEVTHFAAVHCETSTGILNPAAELGAVCARHNVTFVLDAMSSCGGIPMSLDDLHCQFLISSANKCIQGTPGFSFVVADRSRLSVCQSVARSLSLDLYDQWREMEDKQGKWRFTSPTHVVRAFRQALDELDLEGGAEARYQRYRENQRLLVEGMQSLGFAPLLAREHQSPFITSFLYPDHVPFEFQTFYEALKQRRFVIYPGKISDADTFRIGTIGHVFPADIAELIQAISEVMTPSGPGAGKQD